MVKKMNIKKNNNFLYRFLKVVQKYPNNAAIIENGINVTTYKELLDNALRIANFLQNKKSDVYIAISIEKSAKYIAAILGCWFAKKAFMPIDKKLPQNRIEYMIKDAKINYIFSDEEFETAINCSRMKNYNTDIINNYPAYIIYSSGSTGEPKGILVSHNGIVNLADSQIEAFKVSHTSRYLFYLSINFDASISDISVSLLSGAALLIENKSALNIAKTLTKLIHTRQITHMDIPPSLLKLINIKEIPDFLKTIVIGGEACDIKTVQRWANKVNLINVYGPTEATVCTSLCKCTSDWNEPIIGLPIKNTEYKIFNNNVETDYGELYIAGIGLAIGYINKNELTKTKFVYINRKRFYKTGDLVQKLPNGQIKFLGRIDRQVKIRGQLVELEEIEKCLNTIPEVTKSCVLKRPINEKGADNLVAFVELNKKINNEQLINNLKNILPNWMIPARIEVLKKIPTTASGKNNIEKLKLYKFKVASVSDKNLTETEQNVINIFKKITGASKVGLQDNFFNIGGTSLDALELIFACNKLNIPISEKMLLNNATPEFIANYPHKTKKAMIKNVTELKKDIKVTNVTMPKNEPKEKNNILITGATGFLGSTLLDALIENTNYTLYCLTRAKSEEDGKNRIFETFKKYNLKNFDSSRIKIIKGDISQDKFGLSDTQYDNLAEKIFKIYHCAAIVNMLYPYEKLKNANLNGTKRILEFSCHKYKKELHYASTLSVFVSTNKNSGTVTENDKLDDIKQIWGGYGQSKFAAEKYLLNTNLDNIYIYRFGLICGNSKNGTMSEKDFLSMFVKGAQELKILPYDKTDTMAIDITPIDYAVKTLLKISQSNTTKRIFHIANNTSLKYNDLIKYLKNEKIVDNILEYKEWEKIIKNRNTSVNEDACIMSLCRMDPSRFSKYRFLDLFQATNIKFDAKNTHEISKIKCPKPNKDLIKKYLIAWGKND